MSEDFKPGTRPLLRLAGLDAVRAFVSRADEMHVIWTAVMALMLRLYQEPDAKARRESGPTDSQVVTALRASLQENVGTEAADYISAPAYDSTVAADYNHCGCRYEDPRQEELSHSSYDWTRRHTSSEAKRHLGALPFRMDVKPLGGHTTGPTVILVHGTPTLNTLYWDQDRPDSFCSKMAQHAGAKAGDVVCFGHTHKPWHREVEGIHFVNTGSVGRPKDGDWRAGYVLLDVGDGQPRVEFVRVEYDVERTARAILESDLPHEFADYLRLGGKVESSVAPTR